MNKVIEKVKKIGNLLENLLLLSPRICVICRQEKSYYQGLGRNCLQKIAFIKGSICKCCGRPYGDNRFPQEVVCDQCQQTKYYFTTARAVGIYEGFLKKVLAELKYRYRPELGTALGYLLVDWFAINRAYFAPDLIIPIPLHPERLVKRGYNQGELLATPLAKYLGIKIQNDLLMREKATLSQNSLSREARFLNIKNAFRCVNAGVVAQKQVLIIDDIFTTGATVSAAAETLLQAGAREIKILTLTTGLFHN